MTPTEEITKMMKKMNLKFKKLLIVLGVSTMAIGLGAGANTAYADSPSDNKSQEYEEGLKEHQGLQAYNYPLVAAELTTTKGQLPSAQSGISNWSSLPAGTTAAWDKQPTVDQDGKSYGTVIVTFPDKSASVIAVYVTVKSDVSSQSSSGEISPKSAVDSSDVKAATAKTQEKADAQNKEAAKSVQADSESSADNESKDNKAASQNSSADEAANANSTNDSNDQVIVKDVKTEYNKQKATPKSEQPTTKSAQISNTAAASNAELPQTQAKQSGIAIISGIAMAIVGFGMAVINKFKFEK